MRKHRLTREELRPLYHATSGWIILTAERELIRRLGRLRLNRAREARKGWFEPTPTGLAVGCMVARRLGVSLKRKGRDLLAKHRWYIEQRFDLERGIEALRSEFGSPIRLTTVGRRRLG